MRVPPVRGRGRSAIDRICARRFLTKRDPVAPESNKCFFLVLFFFFFFPPSAFGDDVAQLRPIRGRVQFSGNRGRTYSYMETAAQRRFVFRNCDFRFFVFFLFSFSFNNGFNIDLSRSQSHAFLFLSLPFIRSLSLSLSFSLSLVHFIAHRLETFARLIRSGILPLSSASSRRFELKSVSFNPKERLRCANPRDEARFEEYISRVSGF